MNTETRVAAVCRSQLQARVLLARLEQAGVPAQPVPLHGGSPIEIRVPAAYLDQARRLVDQVTGGDAAGRLDMRRLIPALLALGLFVWLVALLVGLLV